MAYLLQHKLEGSLEDRVEGTGEEPLESGMVGVAITKGKVTGCGLV